MPNEAGSTQVRSVAHSLSVVPRMLQAVADGRNSIPRRRESLRIFAAAGLVLDGAQTELVWARLLYERRETTAAQAHFQKAYQQFAAAGCDYIVAQAEAFLSSGSFSR